MFKRMSNLIRGFFGLFLSGMERNNPKALLEVEKENLRVQIAKYNQGLAAHAAMCERLMAQVRRLEERERDLRAKTAANLRAQNTDLAGQYALELQNITTELNDTRKQLEEAEKTYQDLKQAREVTVASAKKKIDSLSYAISDMEVKKATAEMTEMASGMIAQMGGAGETLNRLEEMVAEEREKAAGRARVARDSLDTDDFRAKEAESRALADQALADFAAREGLALPPTIAAAQSTGGVQADTPLAQPGEATRIGQTQ